MLSVSPCFTGKWTDSISKKDSCPVFPNGTLVLILSGTVLGRAPASHLGATAEAADNDGATCCCWLASKSLSFSARFSEVTKSRLQLGRQVLQDTCQEATCACFALSQRMASPVRISKCIFVSVFAMLDPLA